MSTEFVKVNVLENRKPFLDLSTMKVTSASLIRRGYAPEMITNGAEVTFKWGDGIWVKGILLEKNLIAISDLNCVGPGSLNIWFDIIEPALKQIKTALITIEIIDEEGECDTYKFEAQGFGAKSMV